MKILLVDDDTGVIQSLLPVLKSIPDVEVRVAATGEKAIENAGAFGGPDLLVTDVVMEPIDGFTLRDQLKAKYPALRTVFITGYELSDYPKQTAGHTVLEKPVDANALRAAVLESASYSGLPGPVSTTASAGEQAAEMPSPSGANVTPGVSKLPPPPKSPEASPAPLPMNPSLKPKAAAVPRVTATPGIPSPSGAVAAIPKSPSTGDDRVVGMTLGAFRIVRKLGDGRWGGVYEAVQTTMGRTVAIDILAPHLQQDPEEKKKFISSASAKANVQHPLILSVYEAGEIEGYCYYAHEYVEGMNVAEMASKGVTIDEPQALQIVKVVTEAMSYITRNRMAHVPLQAHHVYLGVDGRPRVANLATRQQESQPSLQQEMATLSETVGSVLSGGQASDPGLEAMLVRMRRAGPTGYLSWAALMETVTSLEPKVVPADAFKLSQQDAAAIRAVEEARRRQRRTLVFNLVGVVVLSIAIGSLVYWKFFWRSGPGNVMIKIPAGAFVYQNGEKRSLPDFWIDEHEVTIGQYAEFLEYLRDHPATRFDHPNQPLGHRHEPPDWAIYYGRAKAKKPVRGFQPISLDSPMIAVDWWDAYAYAKWRGHRLPTEEEWEKAARGPDGNLYPWGNQFDPTKVNSAKDHQPKVPTGQGSMDGWNYWSPVEAVEGDRSYYGVMDMAGNVREWTASWDEDGKFPIVRGGSYESESNKTTDRVTDLPATTREEYLGFRTASSEEPTAD